MSTNNQNNSNRREKENKKFNNSQKDTTPIIYDPELMDAEDSLLEIKSSLNKAEKNANHLDKLDFYKDFGDLFDPDVKVKK